MSKITGFVAIAGAGGHLGSLIALRLREANVQVKALVRPGTATARAQQLRDAGATITEVDLSDVAALTEIFTGAFTVVSALQGLRNVMLDIQGSLLRAAVAAKVKRFIPSDFSLDFTKCTPGSNRNLDLRREFHVELDKSGIAWTSILNGAFMDLVTGGQIPLINDSWHRIMHFGSVDQKLDVTTVPDVAAFTAAVAADPRPTPKFLRIAGDSFSAKGLAVIVTRLRGREYKPIWMGSVGFLRMLISIMKMFIGGVEDKPMPAWQGMQYLENMVSGMGKLDPLDNNRYPELVWTTLTQALEEAGAQKAKAK